MSMPTAVAQESKEKVNPRREAHRIEMAARKARRELHRGRSIGPARLQPRGVAEAERRRLRAAERGMTVARFYGVAALSLGRKFIGVEIEPRYFDIACRRIDAENRRPRIPGLDQPKAKQVDIFARYLPRHEEPEPGETVKPLAGHHGHYSRLATRSA